MKIKAIVKYYIKKKDLERVDSLIGELPFPKGKGFRR